MNMIDNAIKYQTLPNGILSAKYFCCLPVGFTVDLLIFAFSPFYILIYMF